MGYKLNTLVPYVDQTDINLLFASVAIPTTSKYVTVLDGIKSARTINPFTVNPTWQKGNSCGSTVGSDTVDITQRELSTEPITVREEFCEFDLEPFFTQQKLRSGAQPYTELAYYEDITSALTDSVNEQLDVAVWQGVKEVSPTTPNTFFDGYLEILSSVPDANASGSTVVSESNIRSVIDQIYLATPSVVKGQKDLVIAMGRDYFSLLTIALSNANLFHILPQGDADAWEIKLPQYPNARIIGLEGLSASKTILTYEQKNLFYGCDLSTDSTEYDVKYIDYNEKLRYTLRWRSGCQVAFPNRVTKFVSK